MNLKFKGKSWAGNIYQKFEAMCQEVDEFVNKDTVKFVETQVQTVGDSVMRFCSGVVQDIVPPSLGDPLKHEAQAVPQKQNDAVGTFTMIGIEEKHTKVNMKQSSVEQDPVDPLKSCKNAAISDENFVVKEEQCFSEVSGSLNYRNSSEMSVYGKASEKNQESGVQRKVSPGCSISSFEIRSSKDEGKLHNSFADEIESVSNISSSPQSSELASSVVSSENKLVEVAAISSSRFLSTEPYNLPELPQATFRVEEEKFGSDPADSIGCVSDVSAVLSSSMSTPSAASDNKDAFSNSVFSLESRETSIYDNNKGSSEAGSSKKEHELCCKCGRLEAFMSSLDIGLIDDDTIIDILDPSMETVDFSNRLKLEESCVIVESDLSSTYFCRAKNFRSYKKIIRDALASRKRLCKEYEQLAIYCGDIDTEFGQDPEQNVLSSNVVMSPVPSGLLSEELCGSDWEVL